MFDVTDNAETQLMVFVEYLSRGHVVSQMGGDKSRVTADLAEQRSHLFASSQSGIGGKDAMTLGCKLVERVWHGRFFRESATAILPARTRIVHYSSSNLVQIRLRQFVPFRQSAAFALWDRRACLFATLSARELVSIR